MIKNLNRDDVQVTPFIAAKTWNIQNIDLDDILLWTSSSLTGGISVTYIDYSDGTIPPFLNTSCSLAVTQNTLTSSIIYQHGENIEGTFFPKSNSYYISSSNPVNIDGTYMRLVYNTNKQLFYNSFDNPTQLWGLENINLSSSTRTLTDAMDVFSLKIAQFGDKIAPNTVTIVDSQDDNIYRIKDDGKTNLLLDGTYFNHFQELSL